MEGKEYDEEAVGNSNHNEGYVAVHGRLFLLYHGFDLHNALVVRDECAEEQKADGAHEGCYFEKDHSPVFVMNFKIPRHDVAMEDQTVADHGGQWLANLRDEAAHRQVEQVGYAERHNDLRQVVD